MQYEDAGPPDGFWPILEPERCKLQCSGHVGFWGALREPSVPYNWTSGAFGTFGPIGPSLDQARLALKRRSGATRWRAADPSRFAKAAARRSQSHSKNAEGSARYMLHFCFDMKRKGRP